MIEKIAKIYDMEVNDLLRDDNYTFINTKNKGDNIGNVVINHLSEKLIEQYELRISEKDEIIMELKETIKELKISISKDD